MGGGEEVVPRRSPILLSDALSSLLWPHIENRGDGTGDSWWPDAMGVPETKACVQGDNWGPDNIGVRESEECACPQCEGQQVLGRQNACSMNTRHPKIRPDPQSSSMQTHYGMAQCALRVLRTQDCLCAYTDRQQAQRGFWPTSGHVVSEPPVRTVALETGPRKQMWNG